MLCRAKVARDAVERMPEKARDSFAVASSEDISTFIVLVLFAFVSILCDKFVCQFEVLFVRSQWSNNLRSKLKL